MSDSVIDAQELVNDLRMCTAYASRVGLLQDQSLLESIARAQEAINRDGQPDVQLLARALNEAVRLIAPITVADLRFGRDPVSPDNQKKGRTMQLVLTSFALVVLALIGYFMDSLRKEQEAIETLVEIQELHPQEKLNALRTLAQYERPTDRRSATYDAYRQRVVELKQISSKLARSYTTALMADNIPMFPTPTFLYKSYFDRVTPIGKQAVAGEADTQPPRHADGPAVGVTNVGAEGTGAAGGTIPFEPCVVDQQGEMQLPPDASRYPAWLRNLLSDSLNDFCFELKVFGTSGGAILTSGLSQLAYMPEIKDKISLRVNWFLPFFYGLLGSIIFVMRSVANVRTPAMEWLPITMRLGLGGVAGIVIGWFSVFTGPFGSSHVSISVPLALAFLTGYGIEILFGVLDKLIRASSDGSSRR
jgi:hypothetical protein